MSKPLPILPIEGVPDKLLQAINSRFRMLTDVAGTGTVTTRPSTGGGTGGGGGPSPSPAVPVPSPTNGLTSFGDSITAGFDAVPLSLGYAPLMASDFGGVFTTYAVSGHQAADGSYLQVYPNTNPAETHNPAYSMMFGVNDGFYYGTNADKQANYRNFLYGMAAWLAIPRTSKVWGQDAGVSTTGTWVADNTLKTGLGRASSTNGSTLTFSIATSGAPIYLGYQMADGNGGTATVTVDGVSVGGTLSAFGQNGSLILTNAGTARGVGLARFTVRAGAHTVVIKITSATGGGNIFTFLWAGTVPSLEQYGGPLVAIGGVTQQYSDAVPANTVYDTMAKAVAEQLAADGLNVVFAPVRDYVDPIADMDPASPAHPNNLGHEHLRNAFELVMRPGQYGSAFEQALSKGILVSISDDQESTAALKGTEDALITQSALGNTGVATAWDTAWKAIKFTALSALFVRSIKVQIKSSAVPTNTTAYMAAYIYTDVAGSPGAIVATGSNVRYGGMLAAFNNYEFAMVANLAAATNYWIVIKQNPAPAGAAFTIQSAATGAGQFSGSSDGVTWTNVNGVSGYYILYGRTAHGVYGNSQQYPGVEGVSVNGQGLLGVSINQQGIYGSSTNGTGVEGYSPYSSGVLAHSIDAPGVTGISATSNGGVFVSSSGTALAVIATTGAPAQFIGPAGSTIINALNQIETSNVILASLLSAAALGTDSTGKLIRVAAGGALATASAAATSPLVLGGVMADVPGASVSLAAGVWLVMTVFTFSIISGGAASGGLVVGIILQTGVATTSTTSSTANTVSATQNWIVTVVGTQTVKLQAMISGLATGSCVAGNTTINCVKVG